MIDSSNPFSVRFLVPLVKAEVLERYSIEEYPGNKVHVLELVSYHYEQRRSTYYWQERAIVRLVQGHLTCGQHMQR
jgi:hypothetical protein